MEFNNFRRCVKLKAGLTDSVYGSARRIERRMRAARQMDKQLPALRDRQTYDLEDQGAA